MTAPLAAASSDADTNAFEVGVEPWVVDAVPVRDEDVAELCAVEVVTETESVVDRALDPDFAVEPEDLDVLAVDEPLL
ncbi:hypothetical protein ACGFK1_02375 [Mycobacterium sp. NPDC048908]|uniref:hypothetical protein n=1 Tax=Mycobacterium sp. NPDC048908 TaxID=3364292 RepID=UPI003722D89F